MDLFDDLSNAIKSLQLQCLQEIGWTISSTRENKALQKLLRCLDAVFMHGLRNKHLGYWNVMKHLSPKDVIDKIERYHDLRHEMTKSHAWLHIALNEKLLEFVLLSVQRNCSFLDIHYYRWALLCSAQVQLVQGILCGLEFVSFNLDALDARWLETRSNNSSLYRTQLPNNSHPDNDVGSSVHINTELLTKSGKKVAKSLHNFVQGTIFADKKHQKVSSVVNMQLTDLTSTCSSYSNLASKSLIDFDEEIILPDVGSNERHNPFDTDSTVYDDPWEDVMMNRTHPAVTRHNLDVLVVDTPIEVIRKKRKSSKKRSSSKTSFCEIEEFQPIGLPNGNYELDDTELTKSLVTNDDSSVFLNNSSSIKLLKRTHTMPTILSCHSMTPFPLLPSVLSNDAFERKDSVSFNDGENFHIDNTICLVSNKSNLVEGSVNSTSLHGTDRTVSSSDASSLNIIEKLPYTWVESIPDIVLLSKPSAVCETTNTGEVNKEILNDAGIENVAVLFDSCQTFAQSKCNELSNDVVCSDRLKPDDVFPSVPATSETKIFLSNSVTCERLPEGSHHNNVCETLALSYSNSALLNEKSDYCIGDTLQKPILLNDYCSFDDSSFSCNCNSQFSTDSCSSFSEVKYDTAAIEDEVLHKLNLNVTPSRSCENVIPCGTCPSAYQCTMKGDCANFDDFKVGTEKGTAMKEDSLKIYNESDNTREDCEEDYAALKQTQSNNLDSHVSQSMEEVEELASPSVATSSPNSLIYCNTPTSSTPCLSNEKRSESDLSGDSQRSPHHIENNLLLHFMLNILHCEDEKIFQLIEIPFQKVSLLFSDKHVYSMQIVDGAFIREASISCRQSFLQVLYQDQGVIISSVDNSPFPRLCCYTSNPNLTQRINDAFLECSLTSGHRPADQLIDRGRYATTLRQIICENGGELEEEITNYCVVECCLIGADICSGPLHVKTGKLVYRWVKFHCVIEDGIFYQYSHKNAAKPDRCVILHNCASAIRRDCDIIVRQDNKIILELRAASTQNATKWYKLFECLKNKTNKLSFGSSFFSAGCLFIILEKFTTAVSLLDVISVIKHTDDHYCDVTVDSVVTDVWRLVFADSFSCETFYRVFKSSQVYMQSK